MTKKEQERKIKLGGGYWLCNDAYCCWIAKEVRTEKGKNPGKTYLRRVSGYTSRIEDALVSFTDSHSREINARSINMLIKEIKSLKSLIKVIGEDLDERTRT